MTEPSSPAKDKNYDLITVLQESLQKVFTLETYATDAERNGDTELAEWFRRIQDNNRTAGEQGKQLLVARMSQQRG